MKKGKKNCSIKNHFNNHACKCHSFTFKNEPQNLSEVSRCLAGKIFFGVKKKLIKLQQAFKLDTSLKKGRERKETSVSY